MTAYKLNVINLKLRAFYEAIYCKCLSQTDYNNLNAIQKDYKIVCEKIDYAIERYINSDYKTTKIMIKEVANILDSFDSRLQRDRDLTHEMAFCLRIYSRATSSDLLDILEGLKK